MFIINALVPFNLLIDTDMGLIKTIQFDYHNDLFFYPGILDASIENQQYLLNTRTDPNPLSIILRDDVIGEAQNLYDQFMEKEYDQILELSTNTSISNLAVVLKVNLDQVIRITALCSSEKEKELLLKRNIIAYKYIVSEPQDVNISEYDTIYVKNVKDLDSFRHVSGKNIYIANYGFNISMIEDKPDPLLPEECLKKYGKDNEFTIFSVYQFDPRKLPVG